MKLSLDHLPKKARELVDLIGLPATLALVGAFGGQVFQVPKGKRRKGAVLLLEIAGVIGDAAATRLAAACGGEYLAVPNCKKAIQAANDAHLQERFDELLAEGKSTRAIANLLAREFGITARAVMRASKRDAMVVSNRMVDTGQMGLFA